MITDMLQTSIVLYAMLGGIIILMFIALRKAMTIGLVLGVMLGVLSVNSAPIGEITSTITAQVEKDVSTLISAVTSD
jgi:hypothetical protein